MQLQTIYTVVDQAAITGNLNPPNSTLNALLQNTATIVTAAGITVLTVNSKQYQVFTGSTTQAVHLPVANTGGFFQEYQFNIVNQSTGNVTVYAQDGTTLIATLTPGDVYLIYNLDNVTANGTWNVVIVNQGTIPVEVDQPWVPTDASGSGALGPFTGVTALYSQISNQIQFQGTFTCASNSDSAAVAIGGLPIAANSVGAVFFGTSDNGILFIGTIAGGDTLFTVANVSEGQILNEALSLATVTFSGNYCI